MYSVWDDARFWIVSAGTIISTLITIIEKRIMNDINRLYERSRKTENDMKQLNNDLENVHQIISGHIQYHQGLKDGQEDIK
jgi:hypothetical protein